MKAKILTIALAATAFAFVACKPEAKTTEEKVKAEGDKVAEGVAKVVESGTEEVEPAPAEGSALSGAAIGAAAGETAPAAPAPTEPAAE